MSPSSRWTAAHYYSLGARRMTTASGQSTLHASSAEHELLAWYWARLHARIWRDATLCDVRPRLLGISLVFAPVLSIAACVSGRTSNEAPTGMPRTTAGKEPISVTGDAGATERGRP